ncbi:peptidyl-tRNA hydrolase ICT1 [Tropilaelaps mercedesae]|uniref:Large ribosomal subunit protein mL62 n=1 Tax=Tropilaelaps mercedesae TaxID=418985 RepID=A0A1V9X9Y8_9ACAR|nr:peptidyl-tRNA hydrolase ICT1 [Tropilaelaps mercedesae]
MTYALQHMFGLLAKRNLAGIRRLAFKSPLNVGTLYGAEPDAIADSPKPPQSTETAFTGYIPMKELIISHCRSSGPGGQNVDKTNTKADVRFHLDSATWIPKEAKQRLKTICASSISKEGFLIVNSDRTRKQTINTADCIDKIRTMVFEACKPPPEISYETKQMLKNRLERAAARRLREKRINSQRRRDGEPDHSF